MNALVKQITAAGLENRTFSDRQLAEILGGSDARRYGLVNRALKDGSMVRLKLGLYVLDASETGNSIHPFVILQSLLPGSYVSFETALAFHGWIPEAVFATASVTPGRTSLERDHPVFGRFTFHPLALQKYEFLTAVMRVKLGEGITIVASPLRAIMDLIVLRKIVWSGLNWVEHGLRIDESRLIDLQPKHFSVMSNVYKHKAANDFLVQFKAAVFARKAELRAGDKVKSHF